MKMPIIIYENGDINLFKNINDAENYLEPIDIKNEEYQIFDSNGNLLTANISSINRKLFGLFNIESLSVTLKLSEDNKKDDLLILLINFLCKVQDIKVNINSLDEAIQILLEEYGYTD